MIGDTKMKNLIKSITALTAALLICSCASGTVETPAEAPAVTGAFETNILKVGQADAIILRTSNHCAVIDCGEEDDGGEVVQFLADNGVTAVDKLFITHFDKDHVGGAAEVLESVPVGEIITPAYEGEGDEYEAYLAALEKHNITPTLLEDEMTFTLDDALFEVYPPLRKSYAEGDNDFSLAVSVTHGENRFLFTGDAEKQRLSEILNQCKGEYDFLKVPHHGRYNTYTKRFFETVKAKYAVITCSDKNPAEEQTVAALEAVGSEVYLTQNGDTKAVSDGTEITVTQTALSS